MHHIDHVAVALPGPPGETRALSSVSARWFPGERDSLNHRHMRLHSTVLVTRQLNRLRDFYTTVLRFRVVEDFGACVVLDCGISLWQPGVDHPVRPPSAARPDEGRGRGFAFELCFEADTTEEFETVAQSIQDSQLPLLHTVRTEPWGQRTIRVEDPDGNLVEWGESIPCFVCRLHGDGKNVDEVASITGLDANRVRVLVEERSP